MCFMNINVESTIETFLSSRCGLTKSVQDHNKALVSNVQVQPSNNAIEKIEMELL